eukprot:g2554.t1
MRSLRTRSTKVYCVASIPSRRPRLVSRSLSTVSNDGNVSYPTMDSHGRIELKKSNFSGQNPSTRINTDHIESIPLQSIQDHRKGRKRPRRLRKNVNKNRADVFVNGIPTLLSLEQDGAVKVHANTANLEDLSESDKESLIFHQRFHQQQEGDERTMKVDPSCAEIDIDNSFDSGTSLHQNHHHPSPARQEQYEGNSDEKDAITTKHSSSTSFPSKTNKIRRQLSSFQLALEAEQIAYEQDVHNTTVKKYEQFLDSMTKVGQPSETAAKQYMVSLWYRSLIRALEDSFNRFIREGDGRKRKHDNVGIFLGEINALFSSSAMNSSKNESGSEEHKEHSAKQEYRHNGIDSNIGFSSSTSINHGWSQKLAVVLLHTTLNKILTSTDHSRGGGTGVSSVITSPNTSSGRSSAFVTDQALKSSSEESGGGNEQNLFGSFDSLDPTDSSATNRNPTKSSSGARGPTAVSVALALGDAVISEYCANRLQVLRKETYSKLEKRNMKGKTPRQKQLLIHYTYRNHFVSDEDAEILRILGDTYSFNTYGSSSSSENFGQGREIDTTTPTTEFNVESEWVNPESMAKTSDKIQALKIKLGMGMLKLLLENCVVTNNDPKSDFCGQTIPAFMIVKDSSSSSPISDSTTTTRVLLTPTALQEIANREAQLEYAHPKHLPMLVPPKPWKSLNDGGYLSLEIPFMRTKGSILQKQALGRADLTKVYDALNFISAVPWAVNDQVLDAIDEAWEFGIGMADIPTRFDNPLPSANDPEVDEGVQQFIFENKRIRDRRLHLLREQFERNKDEFWTEEENERAEQEHREAEEKLLEDDSASELKQDEIRSIVLNRAIEATKQHNMNLHSLRCDMVHKLYVARSLRNRTKDNPSKGFYFPHNLDFRGRIYPTPPSLNHIGADHVRGLLRFNNGKRLGENGLDWLKIHLANLCGVNKISNADRIKWVEDRMDEVRNSARNPYQNLGEYVHQWKHVARMDSSLTSFGLQTSDESYIRSQLPNIRGNTGTGGGNMDESDYRSTTSSSSSEFEESLRIDEMNALKRKYTAEQDNLWWLSQESPWQVLAACQEIDRAMSFNGAKEDFVSYLPVHQDGSCNGLQHYAALGRDLAGAQSVNLTPNEIPQDVYSQVLKLVNKVLQDVVDGGEIPTFTNAATTNDNSAALADDVNKIAEKEIEIEELREAILFFAPLINRKTIKQAVMTHVYGVTRIGATEQIKARLEELADDWKERQQGQQDDLNNEKRSGGGASTEHYGSGAYDAVMDRRIYLASRFLSGAVFNCIGQLFENATEIMQWFTITARDIAAQGYPMSWLTPLGLPVVQPYRKSEIARVQTALQRVSLARNADTGSVNSKKQGSAFPPNYVHSLDSTHMLMTALKCKDIGIDFVSVHDSYWTHASDVDVMNSALRESFVELHEEPLLETLRESLQVRYPKVPIRPLPERGELDIKDVLKSRYFFS